MCYCDTRLLRLKRVDGTRFNDRLVSDLKNCTVPGQSRAGTHRYPGYHLTDKPLVNKGYKPVQIRY